MKAKFIRIIFTTIFLLSALFFFAVNNSLAPRYIDYSSIEWEDMPYCKIGAVNSFLQASKTSIGNYGISTLNQSVKCLSKPFILVHSKFELEYIVFDHANTSVEILNADLIPIATQTLIPQETHITPYWQSVLFTLPSSMVNKAIFIRITQAELKPQGSWFSMRSRINYYAPNTTLDDFFAIAKEPHISTILSFLFSASIISFAFWVMPSLSSSFLFLSFLLLSFCVHFRLQGYFFWDEWTLLKRFSELGFAGIIYRHNEHFLPLFFSIYYEQAKLFNLKYELFLLFSMLIHSLNAFLLAQIIRGIIFPLPHAKFLSRLLGLLFLINSLSSETLHWAFEQSLLLGFCCVLIVFHCGVSYLETKGNKYVYLIFLLSMLAPLFFGNSFIIPIQLLCILLAFLAFKSQTFKSITSPTLIRTTIPVLFCLTALIVPLALYYNFQEGIGHKIDPYKIQQTVNPLDALRYLFVGSQLGTVLRGVGLYHDLITYSAAENLAKLTDSKVTFNIQAESVFAYCALVVSFIFFILAIFNKDTRFQFISSWLLGQALIFLPLIFPALGRSQFGAQQSLFLRYHYTTLLGLAFIAIPMVFTLYNHSKLTKYLLFLTLFGHIYIQLRLSSSYDYFTSAGLRNNIYIQQLKHWDSLESNPNKIITNKPTDSEYAPTYPSALAQKMNPKFISNIITWVEK